MSVEAARGRLRLMRAYDARAVSLVSAIVTGSKSLVQQHFADDVNINTIVRRFGVTGQMPSGVPGGIYGDFSDVVDFEDAVAKVERAREGFMTLPAEVRERFGNDPARLVAFAQLVPEEMLNAELGMVGSGAPEGAPAAPVAPVAPVVAAPESSG